ncbi:MAG: aminoacyl-tRNA hydrolase [Desulfovibrio sp.]|nr:aminoacyl-tRNA hydrolase [Desulfovibrio sp.]
MELAGLVVGLGNPGQQYAGTRHNCGFAFIDALLADCQKISQVEKMGGQKFFCELWRSRLPDNMGTWLCAKPQTFMNESGKSVQALLSWFKLAPGQLVVVHDELDIPPGEIRFKLGGGNAGHNGLRSIEQYIGSNAYYRLRIGIGKPAHKGETLGWVLGRAPGAEQTIFSHAIHNSVEVFYTFAKDGLKAAAAEAKQFGKPEKTPTGEDKK